jgi:ABC-type sugar transport system permease subunit
MAQKSRKPKHVELREKLSNRFGKLKPHSQIPSSRQLATTFGVSTLPILKPALAIIAMLRLIDSFRTFDTIYILTGGGPGVPTQTIGIYIYKTAFITGDFGLASAASVTLVLLLAPLMPKIIKQFRLDIK